MDNTTEILNQLLKQNEKILSQVEENTEILKALEHRVDVHGSKLDSMDNRLSHVEGTIKRMEGDMKRMERKIGKVEDSTDEMKEDIGNIKSSINLSLKHTVQNRLDIADLKQQS